VGRFGSFGAFTPIFLSRHRLRARAQSLQDSPRYLVGGPGWSGAGPAAVGTGVLPLSVDDPGGESHPQQPDAGDR